MLQKVVGRNIAFTVGTNYPVIPSTYALPYNCGSMNVRILAHRPYVKMIPNGTTYAY